MKIKILLLSLIFGLNAADSNEQDQEKRAGKRSATHLDEIDVNETKKNKQFDEDDFVFQEIIQEISDAVKNDNQEIVVDLCSQLDDQALLAIAQSDINIIVYLFNRVIDIKNIDFIDKIIVILPKIFMNKVILDDNFKFAELLNLNNDRFNDYFFKALYFLLENRKIKLIALFCRVYKDKCIDHLIKSGIDWNLTEYGNLLLYAFHTQNNDVINNIFRLYPDLVLLFKNLNEVFWEIVSQNLPNIAEYIVNNGQLDYNEIIKTVNGKSILEHIYANKNVNLSKILIQKYPQLLQEKLIKTPIAFAGSPMVLVCIIKKIIIDKNRDFDYLLSHEIINEYIKMGGDINDLFNSASYHNSSFVIKKLIPLISDNHCLQHGFNSLFMNYGYYKCNMRYMISLIDQYLEKKSDIAITDMGIGRRPSFLNGYGCFSHPYLAAYILERTLKLVNNPNFVIYVHTKELESNYKTFLNVEKFLDLCFNRDIDVQFLINNIVEIRYNNEKTAFQIIDLMLLKLGQNIDKENIKLFLNQLIDCMPDNIKQAYNIDRSINSYNLFNLIKKILVELIYSGNIRSLLEWNNKAMNYRTLNISSILNIFFTENQLFNIIYDLMISNSKESNIIIKNLIKYIPSLLNLKNLDDFNLLYFAIKSNNSEIAEFLIQENPSGLQDVSITGENAFSALVNRPALFESIISAAQKLQIK